MISAGIAGAVCRKQAQAEPLVDHIVRNPLSGRGLLLSPGMILSRLVSRQGRSRSCKKAGDQEEMVVKALGKEDSGPTIVAKLETDISGLEIIDSRTFLKSPSNCRILGAGKTCAA